MNRLRSRKASSRSVSREGSRRPSIADSDVPDAPVPAPSTFSSLAFRRRKNKVPQTQSSADLRMVDLSQALPSRDELRTSLLMPNLCARFSMLKEQDEESLASPSNRIRKAADDSVLFPKRASRLELFTAKSTGGSTTPTSSTLTARKDNARLNESSSPHQENPSQNSARSLSLNSTSYRTGSLTSQNAGNDDVSVMSRARPGEGNTMFGGRQKIYKIPAAGASSSRNLASSDKPPSSETNTDTYRSMAGRPIYESDITQSTFQRLRAQARQEENRGTSCLHETDSDDGASRVTIPGTSSSSGGEHIISDSPLGKRYDRKRETSSSTNSVPSHFRASTAATSVASHKSIHTTGEAFETAMPGLHATNSTTSNPASSTRPRRLHGSARDREMSDLQPSTFQRLGSTRRAQTPQESVSASVLLSESRPSTSTTSLHEPYEEGQNNESYGPVNSVSPDSSGFLKTKRAKGITSYANDQGSRRLASSSPTTSPKSQDQSGPVKSSSARIAETSHPASALIANIAPEDVGKATAMGTFSRPQQPYDDEQYLHRQRQLYDAQSNSSSSPQIGHPRSPPDLMYDDASAPETSRSQAGSSGTLNSRASSIRNTGWLEDRVHRSNTRTRAISPELSPPLSGDDCPPMERSFFRSITSGDASSAPDSESEPGSPASVPPAFRGAAPSAAAAARTKIDNTIPEQPDALDDLPFSTNGALPASKSTGHGMHDVQQNTSYSALPSKASRTFGAPSIQTATGPATYTSTDPGIDGGLSGLVRSHLRNYSGQSSIYPDDSPITQRQGIMSHESKYGHDSALHQEATDIRLQEIAHEGSQQPPLPSPLWFAARSLDATSLGPESPTTLAHESHKVKQMLGQDKAQRILGNDAPRSHANATNPGSSTARTIHHNRGASTETQKEREALAQEMAERRQKVTDNLQSYVEMTSGESEPASPISKTTLTPSSTNDGLSPRTGNSITEFMRRPSRDVLTSRPDKAKDRPSKAMRMLGMADQQIDHDGMKKSTAASTDHPPVHLFAGREQYQDRAVVPVPKHVKKSVSHAHGVVPRDNTSQRFNSHQDKDSLNEDIPYASRIDTSVSPKVCMPAGSDNTASTVSEPSPMTGGKASKLLGTEVLTIDSKERTTADEDFDAKARKSGRNPSSSRFAQTLSRKATTRSEAQSRKASINKHDISEPTFISSTSSFETVDLPPGASLKNGMDGVPSTDRADRSGTSTPASLDGRRKKRSQGVFRSLAWNDSKTDGSGNTPSKGLSNHHTNDESFFDIDEGDTEESADVRSRSASETTGPQGSPRKSRTQSGSKRQGSSQAASPALPLSPTTTKASPVGTEHVPYQAEHDVPASAVMF